jgi:hypothetical protein
MLDRRWPQIRRSYLNFKIDQVLENPAECEKRALQVGVFNNIKKVRYTLSNAQEINRIELEYGSIGEFCKALKSETAATIKSFLEDSFLGIGGKNVNQLARNLGLVSLEKDDSHLVDIARSFGLSVQKMVSIIEHATRQQRGVIDVILWWSDLRKPPPPGLTRRKHADDPS